MKPHVAMVLLIIAVGLVAFLFSKNPEMATTDQVAHLTPSPVGEAQNAEPPKRVEASSVQISSIEERLAKTQDFLGFVEQFEHSGVNNARTARYLARVMKNCAFVQSVEAVASRRRDWAHLRKDMIPGSEKLRVDLGNQLIAKCQSLATQRPQLEEQAKRWKQRADQLGDLEARLREIESMKLPVDPNDSAQMEAFSRAAEQVIEMARGDIDSMDALRLGSFLGSEHGRAMFNDRSPLGQLGNERAGAVALACAMGADCTQDGYIMREGCLTSGLCGYATVQELLQAQVMGSQQVLRLQQLAVDIVAMLRAGDIERLTTPETR